MGTTIHHRAAPLQWLNMGPGADDVPPVSLSADFWVASRLTSGFSDDDDVETWEELRAGNDLTQSTLAKRPTYKTAVINGLSAMLFDGTDDFMSALRVDYKTFFAVVKYDTSAAAPNRIINVSTTDGGTSASGLVRNAAGEVWKGSAQADTDVLTTTTADANAGLHTVIGGATDEYHLDGVDITTGTGSTFGASTATRFQIGALAEGDDANPSQYWKGHIAEVVLFIRVLTTGEINTMESYLMGLYGL